MWINWYRKVLIIGQCMSIATHIHIDFADDDDA
jgi:hypothetical protein